MTAEIAGHTGFDWVCIDAQHGPMGTDTMLAMLQVLTLTGTPTFVRTPWHDPGLIMKVLDGGAVGVIVPMGSTASEAAAAAAACRYPPRGIRSMGPSRAQFLTPCYSARVGDSIALCVPMIETLEGVENVERIVEVPGVDGIFIGPGDLSLAEGYPPALAISAPDHVDRVMRVLEAYLRRRVVPGIYSGDVEITARWRAAGFRMLALLCDSHLLASMPRQLLSAVRASEVSQVDKPIATP
jgi:4-hydroxy-2-oxoheptanedioate aldolase